MDINCTVVDIFHDIKQRIKFTKFVAINPPKKTTSVVVNFILLNHVIKYTFSPHKLEVNLNKISNKWTKVPT